MKHYNSTYITVRIDTESDKELTEDEVQEFISEVDYSFTSRSKGIAITDTEICGINQ